MPDGQEMIEKGATNLLVNCSGIRKGDHLLIVCEQPGLGYYDDEIVPAVVHAAEVLGARVMVKQAPFEPQPAGLPADLRTLMQQVDQTVFLARIGDQLRFCDTASFGRAVVCYALDAEMLASAYGTIDHHAFVQLKTTLDLMLSKAKSIHVTCPAGTDFRGPGAGTMRPLADVGIKRFPMPVFTPIPAAAYSGTVVLPGFLVGTGSVYYEPYSLEYDGRLSVTFDAGHIVRFDGSPGAVEAAERHYRTIAEALDIDRDFVHSWHAGIHPGCQFAGAASGNYERWSGAAFGNPRILHFHTCGAYAPGEISWNVIDPTITIDGVSMWRNGVLQPRLVPGGEEILAQYPAAAALFDFPGRNIGI